MSIKEVKAEEIKPYEENAAKKGQVSTMFNNIAKYYDFLNHFLSLGIDKSWRKKAIATLKDDAPKNILDVATGTGDLAIEAHRQLSPDKVTGIDISVKMLEVGEKKIRKLGIDDVITLQEGDSEHLQFADNTFDAAVVAFGVRNFANVEAGLIDMVRVLQPNSKLVVLSFQNPLCFLLNSSLISILNTYCLLLGVSPQKTKKPMDISTNQFKPFQKGRTF